ncbi:MAG: CDF family Co(II)/Ni(II) efflux transporter DmeF [Candidatus Marinimicrobia bacterium]|nr:CDF family Co(II)/Ni(II) efflux transporter DmeF [Candidatus Neomarinimicrobiota bacterium]
MNIEQIKHEHHFGQHKPKAAESRTWLVVILTAVMMIGEIIAGLLFGSMALLADGLHMASHTIALTISAFAYIYARKHAHDERFSFGTGKIGSLAGFASAILLAMFALIMIIESVERFLNPVTIAFNEAIAVAVLGLIVNVVSVFLLNVKEHQHSNNDHHHHHDHNLRAAYLHVLADALTSVLAIIALFAGKLYGLNWMDPVMGIVGAIMVTRWSVGLLKQTSSVLLDKQAPEKLSNGVINILEKDGVTKVTDLHIWSIGPNQFAAAIEVITSDVHSEKYLRDELKSVKEIVHSTISFRIAD